MSRIFGKAVHTGFVVPDVDAAIQGVLASGIGPVFVMSRIRVPARNRGVRHDLLMTPAFVYSGNSLYEFVEQHDDTPSAYREFLDRHPAGGLHHIDYFCKDFGEAIKNAEAMGKKFNVVQEYITPDGDPYEIYIESADNPDAVLVQLNIPSPLEKFFEDMEKAAATWDGKDPIRDGLALLPPEMRPPTEP